MMGWTAPTRHQCATLVLGKREHAAVSSRAKARRDDRRLGTYTIEASGTWIGRANRPDT